MPGREGEVREGEVREGEAREGEARAEKRASEVLLALVRLAEQAPGGRIALGELLKGTGPRLYGLALILFALPEAIPFPAVGLTGLVAIPIAVVSVTMILRGVQGELPAWIRRREVKAATVVKLACRGAGLVRRIERLSYPRRPAWTRRGRPIGLLCLGLSVVASIPIPFSNVAPGVTLVAIGLGLFEGDGTLVMLACGAGVLICTAFAAVLIVAGQLLF